MLVISDVRGSGARRQVATCGLHGREFATRITCGDAGLLRQDGPSRAEARHLESPGQSTAKRAIVWPSAGPSPSLHQKCPRALIRAKWPVHQWFGEREGRRMAEHGSILVTGAAGQLGAVGRTVTGLLLARGLPVRAMVHREDDRAAALRAAGAEVVVGDLLEPADVYRIVSGCRRVYFGMSVSAGYLEAALTMAAVAREVGVSALVNMSQMTVSEMSIQNTTPSHQQRQHWLTEQALSWSGLPVVTIRPTMFLESLFPLVGASVRERGRIELPFGSGKTSPVAAADVARVIASPRRPWTAPGQDI